VEDLAELMMIFPVLFLLVAIALFIVRPMGPFVGIFLVGCTNRPLADLDAAVLRPGRLEIIMEMSVPDLADRLAILRTLISRMGIAVTVRAP